MNKRAFVDTWFRRVWAEEDLDAIEEMMAPSADIKGLEPNNCLGAQEFRMFATSFLALVGNVAITIDRFMEDGDWVSFLMKLDATSRSTGTPVSMHGMVMARITDNQVQQAYNYVDFISLWEQLGTLPQNTMQACLRGERAF